MKKEKGKEFHYMLVTHFIIINMTIIMKTIKKVSEIITI